MKSKKKKKTKFISIHDSCFNFNRLELYHFLFYMNLNSNLNNNVKMHLKIFHKGYP